MTIRTELGNPGLRGILVEARAIADLAFPIALAQFGLTAIGLVDVAVLGRASAIDLGGASLGRSIAFACGALCMGVAAGLEPLAAQALGAGDREGAWRAYVAALAACGLVWVPSAIVAYAVTFALGPLGIEQALANAARTFIAAQLPGLLFFLVFLVAKTFLQAHGRTRPSLVAAIVANVVNVGVCNVLVLGSTTLGIAPRGALGAGIANSIASFVLAAWVVASAWTLRPASAGPMLRIGSVLRLGFPLGLQLLAEIGVFSFVALLAGRLGRVPVSAHHIAIGLASFTFMGALGIGGATAVRVGYAVGEGKSPRRAGLVGIGVGTLFMSGSALLFLVLRRPLVAAFTNDPDIAALGAELLVVAAAFQLFDGIQAVAAGALRGAADVRFSFAANVGAHWLVGLPLALWLGFSRGFGARGLWYGLLAGLFVVSSLLLWRFDHIARKAIARVT
jgi:multidrug resistance protein, MATE family